MNSCFLFEPSNQVKSKQGKFHPRTDREGIEGE